MDQKTPEKRNNLPIILPVISGVLVLLLLASAVCMALLPVQMPAADLPPVSDPSQASEPAETAPTETEPPTGEDNIGYDIFN